MKIQNVVVLGAGSAGLMAALTLKRKLPPLAIQVVRSKAIGVIGVGEATTAVFPRHFFEYLKIKPQSFYAEANPTWKMGIRFVWGPRHDFFYTFAFEFEKRLPELSRNNGYYFDPEQPWLSPASAYMAENRVFPRQANGMPLFHNNHAFHIENVTFVGWLENRCREEGVAFVEAAVTAEPGPQGVHALVTDTGERITGDLFIDASGFRSELLGGVLKEPFISYADSLFCDRAVIGGWMRKENEPIVSYTIAQTMDCGWCWQIDHEKIIHRGYVYSSSWTSDDTARDEFLRKNPRANPEETRVIKFRSGRYRRCWIGNVVGIGNSAGFVEPLESTALQSVCIETSTLADALLDCQCDPPPTLIELYNRYNGDQWDDIRNFLAVHYRFNTRIDTPFWRQCREHVSLHGAEPIVEFYRENGPSVVAAISLVHPSNSFKLDGFLALLLGQCVPHSRPHRPSAAEREFWRQRREALRRDACSMGMTAEEVIAVLRRPGLKWQ
jgi:tryptophan halogenase